MKKKIPVFDVRLKDIKIYASDIEECFGLCHPNLNLELSLLDDGGYDEKTYEIWEFVSQKKISQLLKDAFPKIADDGHVRNFLWLVANLYYGNSIDEYTVHLQGDLTWEYIEQELLKLYSFIKDHQKSDSITVKIGKDKLELDNIHNWFQSILLNRVFPKCLPNIHSKDEADAQIKKRKVGRPQSREKETVIACGLYHFFSEYGVLEGNYPKNLLSFIRKFLVRMNIINKDDPFVTENWIKTQIRNIKVEGRDPRLFTPTVETVNPKNLPLEPDPLFWIFPR